MRIYRAVCINFSRTKMHSTRLYWSELIFFLRNLFHLFSIFNQQKKYVLIRKDVFLSVWKIFIKYKTGWWSGLNRDIIPYFVVIHECMSPNPRLDCSMIIKWFYAKFLYRTRPLIGPTQWKSHMFPTLSPSIPSIFPAITRTTFHWSVWVGRDRRFWFSTWIYENKSENMFIAFASFNAVAFVVKLPEYVSIKSDLFAQFVQFHERDSIIFHH